MEFLKEFEKKINKMDVITSSEPPRYWYSTGNYALNRMISGSFFKGIPQGRITAVAGPSGAGKSFLACNLARAAQEQGAFILCIDTENALDDGFMSAIGIDIENNYKYLGADTIPECSKILSAFLTGYDKEHGRSEDAPQVVILIDSLDMLMTESEENNFVKGDTKADQGQRAKQLKAMLRTVVNNLKGKNISVIVTCQPYQAKQEQILAGEGLWVIANAIRFAPSLIIMLTKLKLKDKDTKLAVGIRMKCQGHKTRFTKPFQTVTIEVPYDTGMNLYSGLLEVTESMGIVKRPNKKMWQIVGQEKTWLAKNIGLYAEDILIKAEAQTHAFLDAMIPPDDIDEDQGETTTKTTARRKAKKKKV